MADIGRWRYVFLDLNTRALRNQQSVLGANLGVARGICPCVVVVPSVSHIASPDTAVVPARNASGLAGGPARTLRVGPMRAAQSARPVAWRVFIRKCGHATSAQSTTQASSSAVRAATGCSAAIAPILTTANHEPLQWLCRRSPGSRW
ncbi:hypothetical protein AZE42_07038 [Rhizopogon vesiculosus]|uniref:Uncharacterized protein n=1 Tax=Rhizopogon vesiculosus TaxID=180088 RepID=A0A1J8R2A2_9AGAM|nr:hypothetical protein AZE42_07038 [Rhizopogon vesiculosus]